MNSLYKHSVSIIYYSSILFTFYTFNYFEKCNIILNKKHNIDSSSSYSKHYDIFLNKINDDNYNDITKIKTKTKTKTNNLNTINYFISEKLKYNIIDNNKKPNNKILEYNCKYIYRQYTDNVLTFYSLGLIYAIKNYLKNKIHVINSELIFKYNHNINRDFSNDNNSSMNYIQSKDNFDKYNNMYYNNNEHNNNFNIDLEDKYIQDLEYKEYLDKEIILIGSFLKMSHFIIFLVSLNYVLRTLPSFMYKIFFEKFILKIFFKLVFLGILVDSILIIFINDKYSLFTILKYIINICPFSFNYMTLSFIKTNIALFVDSIYNFIIDNY